MQATKLINKLLKEIDKYGDGPILDNGLKANEVTVSTDNTGKPYFSFIHEPEGPQQLPTKPLKVSELIHQLHMLLEECGDVVVIDYHGEAINNAYIIDDDDGCNIILAHREVTESTTPPKSLGADTTPVPSTAPDTAAVNCSTCTCHLPLDRDRGAKATATIPTIAQTLHGQISKLIDLLDQGRIDKAVDLGCEILKACQAETR